MLDSVVNPRVLNKKYAKCYIATLKPVTQCYIASVVSGLQCKYQGFYCVIILFKSWENILGRRT